MIQRTVTHFFDDILKATEAIERFVSHMNYDNFAHDEKTIRAVEREFEIIGEAVKKIPDVMIKKYSEVPWRLAAGMRDRLIHHYWETESEILWKTIQESVPQLRTMIKTIIQNETMRDNGEHIARLKAEER